MEKFLVSNAPYLRSADNNRSTSVIMRDLFIGLLPVILFSIYNNVIRVGIKHTYGSTLELIYPIITLIVAPIFSLLVETLCLFIIKRKEIHNFKDLLIEAKNGFGAFPGLFIVLISPVYLKMWVLLISIAVGVVVGKMLFGGFGQNIFNPAIIGRAFMAFTFSSIMGQNCFDPNVSAYLSTGNTLYDTLAGATPLINYSALTDIKFSTVVSPFGDMWTMLLGTYPGALGETSVIAIMIGFIYLTLRGTIDYKVSLIYIATVFVTTFFAGLKYGGGIWYPTFQVLSGGLFFGAVYMATEPVTSPKTDLGRAMNALMLGVLTVLFRLIGNNPEGVATAIVTMNIFGLMINKYCVKMRVDGKLTKNELPPLIIFLVIFLVIFVYDIIMV